MRAAVQEPQQGNNDFQKEKTVEWRRKIIKEITQEKQQQQKTKKIELPGWQGQHSEWIPTSPPKCHPETLEPGDKGKIPQESRGKKQVMHKTSGGTWLPISHQQPWKFKDNTAVRLKF